MKHLLLTTIAAVVLVGCGKTQEDKNADLELALIEGSIEEVKAAINSGGKITFSLGCDVIVHRDNEIIKLLVDEVEKAIKSGENIENISFGFSDDDKGNIAPCIHLARKAHFELFSESKVSDPVVWGNVFDEDPLAIWRSKSSVQFRTKSKSKETPDECILCAEAYGVCGSKKSEVLRKTT